MSTTIDTAPEVKLPGKGGYVLGILLIVAGVIAAGAFIASGVVRFHDTVQNLARVVVPVERQELRFDHAGTFTLYHEYRSTVRGTSYESSSNESLQLRLTDAAGTALAITPVRRDTYAWGQREGEAIGRVRIPQAGSYYLSASTGSGNETVVAIGGGVLRSIIVPVALAILVGGVLVVAGIVLLVVTAIRRGRAKRARAAHAGPVYTYAGAPYSSPYAPQPYPTQQYPVGVGAPAAPPPPAPPAGGPSAPPPGSPAPPPPPPAPPGGGSGPWSPPPPPPA